MRRALDIVGAILLLAVSAPFLAISALAIKLSSAGPVLYRASRAGRGGESFQMFKLRTMHTGGASAGRITASNDPRVFPTGRILRRSKLDEIPQLLNVVRGQMSLVGPRPEDDSIVRQHYTPFMRESLQVCPGVIGPGSLSYFADELALPQDPGEAEAQYLAEMLPRKIAMELVYVRNISTAYYLQILMRAALGIVGFHSLFQRRAQWEVQQAVCYLNESQRESCR